jgi:TolA-binding protein
LSIAKAQGIDDLRDIFLRERPLWYHGTDSVDGPTHLIQLTDNNSWSSWLLLREGERDIELGQYELADYAMNDLIASHSQQLLAAEAMFNRGTVALAEHEYGRARFYFSEAISTAMTQPGDEAERIAGLALYSIGLAHAVERDQPDEKTVSILEEFLDHYPDNPKQRDALLLLGELAEARGDCQAAIDYYDKIFDNYPISDNIVAENRKAQCLAQLGKLHEAQELLGDLNRKLDQPAYDADSLIARRDQARAESSLLNGEIEMAVKNYAAAESAFLPIVSNPASPYRRRGLLGLAATYQAAERNDSALAMYDRLLAEDSLDVVRMHALFNKALLLQTLGRAGESDSILQRISADEHNAMTDHALVELGINAYKRHDFAAADEALARAVTLARDDAVRARAYTILGAVRLAEGDAAKAIDAFESADKIASTTNTQQDGEVPEARLLRGITLARVNRSAEAITVLNRFIDQYSDHTGIDQALYWLGESYYQSSLYKAAVDVMGTLVEQHPGSSYVPDALYTMGWAQLKQKNYTKAESVFAQLVKAFPLSAYTAEAQIRRGDALYLAGRYDAAVDAYRQIDELNPSAEELAYTDYQTALANYQLGRFSDADTLFQSFATCYTSSDLVNDALYLRGDIALRQGRYEHAIDLMGRFLGQSTQEDLLPRAYDAIGDAEVKLGNTRLAEGAYSIVLSRFPASSYAKRAQEGLNDIAAGDDEENDATTGETCSHTARLTIDRGTIQQIAGHPADAMRELRALDPSKLEGACRQDLLLGIARSNAALGNNAHALDTLAIIIEQFPGSAAAYTAMLDAASIKALMGDTAGAIAHLARIVSEAGDSSHIGRTADLELARLYAHAGQLDSARPLLWRIVHGTTSSMQSAQAWTLLARYESDRTLSDSIHAGLAESARRDDTTGAAALIAQADLFARESNSQQEAATLQELVRRFGGDQALRSLASIRLGEAYERLGSTAKARDVYQDLLRRDCGGTYRKRAQEHLEALGRL